MAIPAQGGTIALGTAKIRDMIVVSNEGKPLGCHLVAIIHAENETALSPDHAFGSGK